MNVMFDSAGKRPRLEKLETYNAKVFNLNVQEELELFLQVMRAYGPGGAESLINTPPDRFFSAKDSSVYMLVEWMGEYTFNQEFMNEPIPEEKPAVPELYEENKTVSADAAIAQLGAKLSALKLPQDKNAGDPTD